MTCTRCKARTEADLESFASDPRCAFPENGPFTADNWNCVTANAIRDICDDHPASKLQWQGDQNYATVQLGDYDDMELESGDSLALWVTWYKRRGKTSAMWILSEEEAPRLPTAADCERIIAALTVVTA
jgi:hypothetical protein